MRHKACRELTRTKKSCPFREIETNWRTPRNKRREAKSGKRSIPQFRVELFCENAHVQLSGRLSGQNWNNAIEWFALYAQNYSARKPRPVNTFRFEEKTSEK